MDINQRRAICEAMELAGLNKCEDCCLVPDCDTCGLCQYHDEKEESTRALKWANTLNP